MSLAPVLRTFRNFLFPTDRAVSHQTPRVISPTAAEFRHPIHDRRQQQLNVGCRIEGVATARKRFGAASFLAQSKVFTPDLGTSILGMAFGQEVKRDITPGDHARPVAGRLSSRTRAAPVAPYLQCQIGLQVVQVLGLPATSVGGVKLQSSSASIGSAPGDGFRCGLHRGPEVWVSMTITSVVSSTNRRASILMLSTVASDRKPLHPSSHLPAISAVPSGMAPTPSSRGFHPAQFPHNRQIPHNSRTIPANLKS